MLLLTFYVCRFLEHCDYFVGSPTALADENTEKAVREAVSKFERSVYLPAGALWGASDICKMKERQTLKALTITMAKHPSSFKLEGDLIAKLEVYYRLAMRFVFTRNNRKRKKSQTNKLCCMMDL
jgi:predicted dinucleotide-utilizing enzyme